jgi:hypothetical protein
MRKTPKFNIPVHWAQTFDNIHETPTLIIVPPSPWAYYIGSAIAAFCLSGILGWLTAQHVNQARIAAPMCNPQTDAGCAP